MSFLFVTPGFLPAMGIPLRAGRFLTEADTSEDVLFAVVNQAAVNRYWPDRNPVGAYGRMNRADGNRFQVVGVVGDIRNDGLNKAPEAELYLLSSLIPGQPDDPGRALVAATRTDSFPTCDVPCRASIARSPFTTSGTMNDIVRDSLQLERVSSLVMTFFALAALLLATLGIYGVVCVRRSSADGRDGHADGARRREPRSADAWWSVAA